MLNKNNFKYWILPVFILISIAGTVNYKHIKELENILDFESKPIVQEEVIDNKEPNFKFDHFNEHEILLEIVANSPGYIYYRDTVTDVMYMAIENNDGLTVMLEPDTGKPLTYTRYLELYKGE